MIMEVRAMGKLVGIAEFKAKCERLLSQMEQDGEPIQLTRRGKVVGVISPPPTLAPAEPLPSAFGLLKSDAYRFDDPFSPVSDMEEWDRNNPGELYNRS